MYRFISVGWIYACTLTLEHNHLDLLSCVLALLVADAVELSAMNF